MPTLSSSIVTHKVASVREVEEALARQVLYGGDLATNLLELATVNEAELTALLADNYGFEPAPVGELPSAPEFVLRLVPSELAVRYGVYPLFEQDGQLHVAVSEPLPGELEQDLSFSLGLKIVQRAAPLVRIRQALARDFKLPMDRRTSRVVAKLEGKGDPSPSSIPNRVRPQADLGALPRPPSVPAPASREVRAVPGRAPVTRRIFEGSLEGLSPATVRGVPALAEGSDTDPEMELTPLAAPVIPAEAFGTPPPPDIGKLRAPRAPQGLLPDTAAIKPLRTRSMPTLASLAEPTRPSQRPRRLGPYTPAMAEQDLLESSTLDEVLSAFFDFAAQYFEYSALFAVHGDIAEGRDAAGPGAGRRQVNGLGIPLDLPGALAEARNAKTWQLLRLGHRGLDGALAADLQRKPGRLVLVLPILVRERTVLILYGDHGEADVELSAIGDVISFVPLVAAALERIIVKRKVSMNDTLQPEARLPIPRRSKHPRPSPEQRAAALASALQLPESARPPARTGTEPPRQRRNTPVGLGTPSTPPKREASSAPSDPVPMPLTRRSGEHDLDEGPELEWQYVADEDEAGDDRSNGLEAPHLPASLSISHPARRPRRARESGSRNLPSVIVDVTNDCATLVQRLIDGDSDVARQLVHMGEPAATTLSAVLPGPITSPLRRSTGDGPARASECGPVLRTLARMGAIAVPFVVVRSADADPVVRAWTTRLLGEMPTPEAAQAVARRVFDQDEEVRRAALAAGRFMQSHTAARDELRRGLLELAGNSNVTRQASLAAIRALQEVRDSGAVPGLAQLLQSGEQDVAAAAHEALQILTRQDFERSPAPWLNWWHANSHKHRIEWLIDSLMHEVQEIRRAAGDELKNLTKEYFGYYDDLPHKERARAQMRYREWWESKGKARFH